MRIITDTKPQRRRARRVGLLAAPLLVLVAGCGPTRFEAQAVMPQPLITRIPVVVGVYVPEEFRAAVHREDHGGADYEISIGRSQSAGFERLLGAMFERVVPVASPQAAAATDPAIRGVLEPVLEEFSFVTPQDTGDSLYAVSLRYRINAYTPSGQPVDSWIFTGYGAQPASSMPGSGSETLQKAAAIAMRDAGAKLVVEFREQAIARGLVDGTPATPPPVPAEAQSPP